MNSLRYTRHAMERMAERGISPADVELAVADPDSTFQDQYGNPTFKRRLPDGRKLQVVISAQRGGVVTVKLY